MAGEVSKAVKPKLRGLLAVQIRRNILLAAGVATLAAVVQKIFVNDNRKKKYSEFYKTYDVNKAFNAIRNKGLFDSCEPDRK